LTATTDIQAAIIKRAITGDADAQAWLYQTYSKAMFNICIRMTGSQTYAEDVLQDAFVLALSKLKSLKNADAFAGWLKKIVVNECIKHCKQTLEWNIWDDGNEVISDEPTDWWTTISLEVVHQEIKNLPDGCRQIFVLYAMEDNGHAAIAAQLGISEGTSKSQYHRAKKLLRERVSLQMETHG